MTTNPEHRAFDPGSSGETTDIVPPHAEVTRLLVDLTGSTAAAEELLPMIYHELRRLAASAMSNERAGLTLDATSLVHEAYVRLVQGASGRGWDGRAHFFAAAAITMRRILVEGARRRSRIRHGGGLARTDLNENIPGTAETAAPEDLLSLDAALDELEKVSPRRARVVMLRYFTGLTIEETASALGIAPATAKQDWAAARAWLKRRVDGHTGPGTATAP